MHAAVVRKAGQGPSYEEFPEPVAAAGDVCIAVTAAAISPVARSRAAGTHYSIANAFPFVAGIDGVGRRDDGRRVYFANPRAPFGSMAERTVAPAGLCIPLPDALDDVTAAAIANPGMSSWMAYTARARLKAGETVLINGATGTAGRLAVQIARHMGAGKIVVTGRNAEALQALSADVTIALAADDAALTESFEAQFAAGIDVVIDYLWGRSAEHLLAAARAGADGRAIRFVQLGAASGADITLPSAVLRSAPLELMGGGLGSVALDGLAAAIGELFAAAAASGFTIATETVPLARVAQAWTATGSTARIVLTPM